MNILNNIFNIYSFVAVEARAIDKLEFFMNDEVKWIIYGALVIFLIVAVVKRATIWALGVLLTFAVFAYFSTNPMDLMDIAEDLAKTLSVTDDD